MPVAVEPTEAGHHLLVPRVEPERVEVRSPSWPYSAAANLSLSALLVATVYLPIFVARPPAALAAVLVVPAVFAALLARVVFESNAAVATRRGDAAGPVKAALESCTRYLAAELGPKGIRVHAISPGPLKTRAASGIGHFDELLAKAQTKATARSLVSIEDVGLATAYLATDAAKLITGETIYIDGGYHVID